MNMVFNNQAMHTSAEFGIKEKPRQEHSQSQGLDDVIKQLVQALLKGGKDSDSGLGHMVKDQLSGGSSRAGGSRGSLEELLTRILEQLIGEKLGKDFGQPKACGDGGGEGAASGQPGMGQSGGSNLLERVLSGLAKSSLDGMLKPDGEGSKFEQKDAGMMQEVAKFMDANPKQFPPPDSGSWSKELIEDKYLNKSETEAFKSALGMIGGQLDAKASGQVSGGASSQVGSGQDSLGGTGGLGSPSSKPSQAGGDALRELTEMLAGVMEGVQNLTKKLDVQNLGQGAMDAANSIVNLMLPGGRQRA